MSRHWGVIKDINEMRTGKAYSIFKDIDTPLRKAGEHIIKAYRASPVILPFLEKKQFYKVRSYRNKSSHLDPDFDLAKCISYIPYFKSVHINVLNMLHACPRLVFRKKMDRRPIPINELEIENEDIRMCP